MNTDINIEDYKDCSLLPNLSQFPYKIFPLSPSHNYVYVISLNITGGRTGKAILV